MGEKWPLRADGAEVRPYGTATKGIFIFYFIHIVRKNLLMRGCSLGQCLFFNKSDELEPEAIQTDHFLISCWWAKDQTMFSMRGKSGGCDAIDNNQILEEDCFHCL